VLRWGHLRPHDSLDKARHGPCAGLSVLCHKGPCSRWWAVAVPMYGLARPLVPSLSCEKALWYDVP
jgi:hypothetical protein